MDAAIFESKHTDNQEFSRISSIDDLVPDFLSLEGRNDPLTLVTTEAMLIWWVKQELIWPESTTWGTLEAGTGCKADLCSPEVHYEADSR